MNNKITRYDNDNFFSGNWIKNFFDLPIINNSNILKTNIRKEGSNYIYEIDVPGYSKEDISVDYDDGYLIIGAKTSRSTNNNYSNDTYVRQERYTGTCSRSYYIGEIDESKISAKYNNGILSITIPDSEKEQKHKSKTININ